MRIIDDYDQKKYNPTNLKVGNLYEIVNWGFYDLQIDNGKYILYL